jgi:succinate-semialdehyde dehydrogenase / glutarate-semialdehyde dehydrogenase
MAIATVNPATGDTLETFEALTDPELGDRIDRAAAAFEQVRREPLEQRLAWLRAAAGILDTERRRWAELMVREMGKPIRAAEAEAEKCALVCRYYADHAARFLADEPVHTGADSSWIRYEPLGPVLAVMPWNFPFWQVFRFAAPALAAGNVGLLKHASNVPRCALAIEEIFRRAGVPDGGFQALLVGAEAVPRILDDPRVRAVTLTGSEGAGRSIGAEAGRRLKKTVLELGGSDPFIVMPSADLDRSASVAVQARTINNGQSCIAAKRFIVHADVYDAWLERFADGMRNLRVGDPMDPETDVGPLATSGGRDEVEAQVRESVAAGARLVCGGARPDRPGYFFEPTVLADIPEGAPAYRDEVFGPVASVFRVRDVSEALRLANDTPFGLGASVWTRDEAESREFVERIEAGLVFVNAMVASDPRLPFGGVKNSGYGRELGVHGIREFVNIKTVRVDSAAPGAAEGMPAAAE